MAKLIILTIVAIVLVGIVVFMFSKDIIEAPVVSPYPTPSIEETPTLSPTPTPTVLKVTVTYSNSGYSPVTIAVKKGDAVIFENKSSIMIWTASALHPTHKVYPGSDIAKCGTSSQTSIFDACKGYSSGESWEFRFNEQGTWKYHNHLQPNHTGTIIVD